MLDANSQCENVIETGNCMFCGRLISAAQWVCPWCDWTPPGETALPVIDVQTGAFTALEVVEISV